MRNQFDECRCGHNRNSHDKLHDKPAGECDALVDGKQCSCRSFRKETSAPPVAADAPVAPAAAVASKASC